MTMQRCLRVSKEQNIETTNGFSAKVRMSRSTNTCWIWFLRIRFCRLIFFMAKRWRVSLWRTRNTVLHDRRTKRGGKGQLQDKQGYEFMWEWGKFKGRYIEPFQRENMAEKKMRKHTHHLPRNISSDLKLYCPEKRVETKILQQEVLILVSLLVSLSSLWCTQRDWVSRT